MNRNIYGALCLGLAAVACAAEVQDEPSARSPAAEALDLSVQAQSLSSTSGYTALPWEVLPDDPASSLANLRSNLWRLQGRNIALTLHWPSTSIDTWDQERWDLVQSAHGMGIPVYPWVTLPEAVTTEQKTPGTLAYSETGYFPNSTNYASWISRSQFLMFLWRSMGYGRTTMVVDFEMRKEKLHEFDDRSSRGDVSGVLNLLRENTNRARQADAIAAFRNYVQYAHSQNFNVAVSTLLPVLEDYADGDDSLRQGFTVPLENAPTSAGAIQWDVVSFQAHRSLYRKSFANLAPYFVYDYARMALQYFGSKAGIDLGLTHAGIGSGNIVYTGPNELRQDTGAAVRAGIPSGRIGVYSFLGIVNSTNPDLWFQAPLSYTPPVFGDSATSAVHVSQRGLDALLVN
jgi:hypothetical protein